MILRFANIIKHFKYLYLSDYKSLYYKKLGLHSDSHRDPATGNPIFLFNEGYIRKDGYIDNNTIFLFMMDISGSTGISESTGIFLNNHDFVN
jgi:hypothetical protein